MALSGLFLRCPLADCETMIVPAHSGALAAGEMFLFGACVGIAVEAIDTGEDVVAIVKAPSVLVTCPAAASGDYGVGEKVYFDVSDKEVNQDTSGNYMCGVVREAPAAGDEEVLINFNGVSVTAT